MPQIRERVELPDGDFLDLMWTADNGGPLVVVLHGLEGCHASAYARGTVTALAAAGFRAVFMHFRGCSGELKSPGSFVPFAAIPAISTIF